MTQLRQKMSLCYILEPLEIHRESRGRKDCLFCINCSLQSKRNVPGMLEMYVMLRSFSHLSEHGFSKFKTIEACEILGEVPRRAMKVIKDLKAHTFEGRLKEQELFLL